MIHFHESRWLTRSIDFCVYVAGRELLRRLSAARMRETNPKCKVVADIGGSGSAPLVDVEFGEWHCWCMVCTRVSRSGVCRECTIVACATLPPPPYNTGPVCVVLCSGWSQFTVWSKWYESSGDGGCNQQESKDNMILAGVALVYTQFYSYWYM